MNSADNKKYFSYDEYSDSLIISNRQENEKVKENFEIGSIIFSLAGKGKIVSIEIRGASPFLESCNIDNNILKNLTNASLNVVAKNNTLFLMLKLESLEEKQILTKSIPLVVPIAIVKG